MRCYHIIAHKNTRLQCFSKRLWRPPMLFGCISGGTELMICSMTFSERLIRYTASVLLQLAYGHRVTTMDDKYVQLSEIALQRTNDAGTPGLMPVDLFPACQSHFSFFCSVYLICSMDSK